MNIEKHKVYIMTIIFLFVSLLLLILLNPLDAKAEDFYNGSYITYYQDANLQTAHLGAYGVYFVNGTAYNSNTSNFRDNWFYTTHLDTTGFQGGSIYIPYTLGYSVPESTTSNGYYAEYCSGWSCDSAGNCTCFNAAVGHNHDDVEYYASNISLIIRCYYNGTTTFVPGRVEGSNIVCPVQQNATYLAGIRIFHRVIGTSAFSYQLGLASGITTYTSTASQVIEAQQATTNAIQDSSTNSSSENSTAISGFENQVGSNSTITSLFVMPITLFQSVLNSVSGTCTPFSLGSLLGTTISFPCIDMSSLLGSSLWSTIDVIASGYFIFYMAKRFISIFENFTSMKDEKDEVAD